MKKFPMMFLKVLFTFLLLMIFRTSCVVFSENVCVFGGIVTIRSRGGQLFSDKPRPVLVPERGIFLIRRMRSVRLVKLGTGMVISPRGYILTSAHTLRGLETVEVVCRDNRKIQAKIIKTYPEQDIALIKADTEEYTEIPLFGRDEELFLGEKVFLFNNPSGNEGHMVSGRITSIGNSIPLLGGKTVLHDLVEVNARVEIGSSGGPVFDEKGRIVGMVAAGHEFTRNSTYFIRAEHLDKYFSEYFQ